MSRILYGDNYIKPDDKIILLWGLVGVVGFLFLPWYGINDGFWSFDWVANYLIDSENGSAFTLLFNGKIWLLPFGIVLISVVILEYLKKATSVSNTVLVKYQQYFCLFGLGYLVIQGLAVGLDGWEYEILDQVFPNIKGQYGMGYGTILVALGMLFILTRTWSLRGVSKGDYFVVSSLVFVVSAVAIFIYFPLSKMFALALVADDGSLSLLQPLTNFIQGDIWSLGCLYSAKSCGVAWNSFFLAVSVGISTTVLGLIFALTVTRSNWRFKKVIAIITTLPIITPPFVIGLTIILLFGLSGTINQWYGELTNTTPTRWIYGFPGIYLAQVLAFSPIAFLVLIGVVEGVSPSIEEASQTLNASPWQTFITVSLPLMRPGLAGAFLLGFIESMADFGNPLVLGGNYDVLSTEIFFSIIGAQNDPAKAGVLTIVLLFFTLSAFSIQRWWLGNKSYESLTGKGSNGMHSRLPKFLSLSLIVITFIWSSFIILIYGMIMVGGFVKIWGLDNSFTLQHYSDAFAVSLDGLSINWQGVAWDSLWTTVKIAVASAPITAAFGLLISWLLIRHKFYGKRIFEFGTMMSFAIPGTVIGVSYIIAFNIPPIEITGTAVILVLCFVFRNLPVGVRAGMASLMQIDKSLDEASLTLGANNWKTIKYVLLPLIKPAITATLAYSFIRSMTAISAVIFLVSAEYNMATSYIIGRVENNDYGIAIAYSSGLIVLMLVIVILLQIIIRSPKFRRLNTV